MSVYHKALLASDRRIVTTFFVLLALPFLAIFPYIGTINNPNENTRTFMTMALVEQRTFALDDIVERHGWTNDMARVKGKDGAYHMYCVKGPANGYAGVPVYWVYRKIAPLLGTHVATMQSSPVERDHWLAMSTWVIRLFTVSLPCFLFLVWLERYLRAFSNDVVLRLAAIVAVGIGTNYLGYALMNVSHSLFGVSSFLAFALTERELRLIPRARDRRLHVAFAVGLCAGWTVMLEYHALPLAMVLTIYGMAVFYRPTRLLSVAAGGLVCVALVMVYQHAQFGNAFTPGHLNVENPLWAEEHKRGVFGIILPTTESVSGLSLPIGSGFFGMSPYMWLGLCTLPFAVRPIPSEHRSERQLRLATRVWLLAMAALWFAASGAIEWRAGWTLGPRRLGAAPPFFVFGAIVALEKIARRGPRLRTTVRGISSGMAMSGALATGFVGIVYNTLPEPILRPFKDFALPLARAGFVPHHIGEWFGESGTAPWYFVAGALLCAAMMPMLVRARKPLHLLGLRLFLGGAAFAICFYPQLTKPAVTEVGDHAPNLAFWIRQWEPSGRDRLTKLQNHVNQDGGRDICSVYRLADLERTLGLSSDAVHQESQAKGPRPANCKALPF